MINEVTRALSRGSYSLAVMLFIFLNAGTITPSQATDLDACAFSLPPFGGVDDAGNPVGIIPDIIDEIRRETDLDIKINVVPYRRMFKNLAVGKCDFAIFFRTEKSEEIAVAKALVYSLKNVVVGLKGLDLHEYSDLYSRTIALPRGNFYQKKFDNDTSFEKMLVPGFMNALKMLINKRTDLIAGPEISFIHHLKDLGLTGDTLGRPYVLSYSSAWLQVSAKSKNMTADKLQRLTDAIDILRQGATIAGIIKKYY